MARECTICAHPAREAIDQMIVSGASNRSVVAQFEHISLGAVQRHKAHIPPHLAKAKQAQVVTQADNLLSDLQYLKGKALSLLNQAEASQDLRACASLIGQARQTIETLAEVRGELDRTARINITYSPVWIETRTTILQALAPYPDARLAVSKALEEGPWTRN